MDDTAKRPGNAEKAQTFLNKHFYTGESFTQDGVEYKVGNAKKMFDNQLSFEKYFSHAQRTEPVYVWHPKAGDIVQESGRPAITAEGTETVFLKRLNDDGALKIYIPSDSKGPLDESVLDEKYSAGAPVNDNAALAVLRRGGVPEHAEITVRAPKELRINILHECIREPSVILNARGPGKHQFMQAEDSLKFEDGECLPLPKKELDFAWRVTERAQHIG